MYLGKTLFAQIMDFLPSKTFHRIVDRYSGDYRTRGLSCAEQFRVMAFAQLTYRESLRDIETCLRGVKPEALSHRALARPVVAAARWPMPTRRATGASTPTSPRAHRQARRLYADEDLRRGTGRTRSMPWTPPPSTCACRCSRGPSSARTKAAIKLHTLLDLRGNIPRLSTFPTARLHDVNILDLLLIEPGAFYIMDRGYLDFARLYRAASGAGPSSSRGPNEPRLTPARYSRRWIDNHRAASATRPSC